MAALIACARPAAADVTTEIEKGIGRWMAQAFIAQRGRLDQPPIDDWITGLGRHLLEHTPRRSLEHRFIVLDSPEVNGFALPGGWVFVTAGLLETMNSEDELAAVMAHELGHVANRDFQRVLLRTALWLGLAEVLRSNDAGDWVPLVHGVQLVETLGHSRRREAQADATGARIAWGAGYDPRAMAAFLGDAPKWSYLQTVFSTHPHPARRSGRLDARFSELRAADPDGALALARSLIERGRGSAAAEVLADPLAPTHEDERAALLARLHERPAAPPEAHDRITLSPEQAAAVVKAVSASRQARVDSKEAREAAWQRLRRLWDDRQVQQGLVVAQAVDPEPGNPGYLLLVAQSVNLLHRSMRGGNLVGRTLQMREEAARELEALGGRAGSARADPERASCLAAWAGGLAAAGEDFAEGTEPAARELARLAAGYHECARLTAPLLVELALAGGDEPGRRLTYARFMLIEARVQQIEERIGRLDGSAEALAAGAWRSSIAANRMGLDLAALVTGEDARNATFTVLARRMGTGPEAFAEAWDGGVMPGTRALELLAERMHAREGVFRDDLRATQILIRFAWIEVKEQVAWGAKEKSASEGADTLALRSAVRHPQ